MARRSGSSNDRDIAAEHREGAVGEVDEVHQPNVTDGPIAMMNSRLP
jgi:hypothetical protein